MNEDTDDTRRRGDRSDNGAAHRRWHFDRRVTMGEVVGAVSIMITIYLGANSVVSEFRTALNTMDKRITVIEVKQEGQVKIDERQDKAITDGQMRIEDALREIRGKLDRNSNGGK